MTALAWLVAPALATDGALRQKVCCRVQQLADATSRRARVWLDRRLAVPACDRRVRAMFGTALLTILSLAWNAWWVNKRGQFGRGASAASRPLYLIVLGLVSLPSNIAGWAG
jgi:hypothetical protein